MKYLIALAMSFATFDAAAYFPSDAAISLLMHSSRNGADSQLCLSIDNSISSDSFVAMAAAKNIRISPIMGCKYNQENETVTHQQSRKKACFMHISDFMKTGATLATAKVSINCGFMSSSSGTAVFLRSSNRWVVKEVKVAIVQ